MMNVCQRTGKIIYATFGLAQESLFVIGKCRPTLNAYHCDSCSGWHLGNWRRKRVAPNAEADFVYERQLTEARIESALKRMFARWT